MNPSLEQLRQAIHAAGVVSAAAVKQLQDEIPPAEPIGRDEADLLFEIHARVSGAENDPSWEAYFVEALAGHVLGGPSFAGVLDEERAAYLLSKLDTGGRLDRVEIELLVCVCHHAASVPDRFLDYVLAALQRVIVEGGPVGEDRVGQVRRVVFRQGLAGQGGIERKVADFLFDLNDAITDRPNHDAWTELFVEAISDHVLEDEESPGEVDADEAAWLVNRLEADQQYDDTEKALLAKIRHFIRHDEVWGGIRSDDLQAATSGVIASLYSRACDGGKGGDIYYFSVSASDMLTRIAVADVLGHGQTVTDISRWIYDSLAARMNSAEGSDVLADLNRLAADRGYRALTTAAVVTFYRADSSLQFSYAGHPPLFARRAPDGRWREVALDESPGAVNLPLGVDSEMHYDQQQIALSKGDRIFMYTDGLVEAPNAEREIFGTSRLLATLEAESGESPKDTKDAVLAALGEHTGGQWTHDDVTFLVVEVR
ncbi:MAG: PP2C family protein-serine/threonine phosphatase [Planctomycetota bacterium]